MKIALVHEFLTQLGGAERVLETLHEVFPDAPVFTLIYDEQRTESRYKNYDLRISPLQKFYKVFKSYKWLLPFMPRAIERLDFSGYDLVISDSSAFAKGIITKKPTVHICYCHTPTRYIWESRDSYIDSTRAVPGFLKGVVKYYVKHYLQKWDYAAAQRPDKIIANSQTVKERIKKYYHREAEVIYPPVDTDFFRPSSPLPSPLSRGEGAEGEEFYLTASRLEPYKKIDIVIEAFNKLDLPLKVAGLGSQFFDHKSKIINQNIEFLGRVSDEKLRYLFQGAKAFIFPALEDAGIMVLESLACGTPVIGLNSGGTAEFIKAGEHGVLFDNQTADDIAKAVGKVESLKFNPAELRSQAEQYSKARFKRKIRDFISSNVRNLTLSPSPISERGGER